MGGTVEQQLERKMAFVRELKCLPVAVQTATANEQHYEVRPCSASSLGIDSISARHNATHFSSSTWAQMHVGRGLAKSCWQQDAAVLDFELISIEGIVN
jgi:hypothetical protein